MKTVTREGRKIIDGKQGLKLKIKPCDIDKAICRDHQRCVIARAILRRKGVQWVDVGASTVLVATSKKTCKRYLLGNLAREQVRYFDTHDGAFAPCRLELSAPTPKNRLGLRTGAKARSGPHGKWHKRSEPTR